MSFTPGPWQTDRNHRGVLMGVYGPGRRHDLDFVCTINHEHQGDHEANARLIAAAPDLLAACGAAMKVLPSLGVNNWPPGHALKKDAICNLQSAIAKAKGEV